MKNESALKRNLAYTFGITPNSTCLICTSEIAKERQVQHRSIIVNNNDKERIRLETKFGIHIWYYN